MSTDRPIGRIATIDPALVNEIAGIVIDETTGRALFSDRYSIAVRVGELIAKRERVAKAEALRDLADYVTQVGEDGKRTRSETHGFWDKAHGDLTSILAMHESFTGDRPAHELLTAFIRDHAHALTASQGDADGRGSAADRSQGPSRRSDGATGRMGDGE